MRTLRAQTGPFAERPYYTLEEIERICSEELQNAGHYPATPEPVRVERFIEKRFGISPIYDDLPEGVLGFTKFSAEGVEAIVVSRSLAEEHTKVAERRVNTTLGHEAGHGLLHAHLFVLGCDRSLFGDDADATRILCRDVPTATPSAQRGYDGRWWEFQANQAMGALLLPRRLADQILEPLRTRPGVLGRCVLEAQRREEALGLLAETFDVNPVVARIRLGDIHPQGEELQLTL
jgi:hypothetical protein